MSDELPPWGPGFTDDEIGRVARDFEQGRVPWTQFFWGWQLAVAIWLVRAHPAEARERYVAGWRLLLPPGHSHVMWFDEAYLAARIDGLSPGEGPIAALVSAIEARRGLRDEAGIATLMADWESGRLPLLAWGHREHLTVAMVLLRQADRERATARIREGIQRYNRGHGLLQGYHETVTLALIERIERFRAERDRGQPLPELLPELFGALCDKAVLLRHYRRETLNSPEARARWIEPDLEPFDGPGV